MELPGALSEIGASLRTANTSHHRRLDLSEFTDAHISVSNVNLSLIFPGPRHPEGEEEVGLLSHFLSLAEKITMDDFMIHHEGYSFRGHRERNGTDGNWYRLRRLPKESPSLDELPTALPGWLSKLMLSPDLDGGGLIYFMGSPAQGKTTTAAAMLVSRLRKYGGYAQTIEDPPEMPLNGWHGTGYCSQTWLGIKNNESWADAIKGALRSMPARTRSILFIGEVRDSESAQEMLRAAANGFLVIATGFASDVISGLQALCKLAGDHDSVYQSLAISLRLAVHLKISNGVIRPKALVSGGISTSVGTKIRNADFIQLENDMNYQQQQVRLGKEISFTDS